MGNNRTDTDMRVDSSTGVLNRRESNSSVVGVVVGAMVGLAVATVPLSIYGLSYPTPLEYRTALKTEEGPSRELAHNYSEGLSTALMISGLCGLPAGAIVGGLSGRFAYCKMTNKPF